MSDIDDLHIEDFCKDTAKILLALYKRFPQKSTLYVEDISGPDTPDEFGLHSPRHSACFNTLLWLAENDYLHFSDVVRQEALENVVLSHRAFTFLSSWQNAAPVRSERPPAEQGSNNTEGAPSPIRQTRIEELRSTLLNMSSTQLRHLVLAYMQQSRDFC